MWCMNLLPPWERPDSRKQSRGRIGLQCGFGDSDQPAVSPHRMLGQTRLRSLLLEVFLKQPRLALVTLDLISIG